jgi:hypothetical protein
LHRPRPRALVPLWSTAARLLEPGDLLTLLWSADVASECAHNAGLAVDDFALMVQRPGHSTMFFSLASSITEPASPQRWCTTTKFRSTIPGPTSFNSGIPIKKGPHRPHCAVRSSGGAGILAAEFRTRRAAA